MRKGLVALVIVAVLAVLIFLSLSVQAGITGNSVLSRFIDFFDRSSSSSGNQNLKTAPSPRLIHVWDSPSTGGNIFDSAIGDLDNDGKKEIIYPNWQPTKEVVIFENIGDNNYVEVWSYQPTEGGIIKTLDIYDYDNDGNDELILGNYNNAYYIFKNNGDNSYYLLEHLYFYSPVEPEIIRGLEVADTNSNGINEIVMARSGSADPNSGLLEIYEGGNEIFEDYFSSDAYLTDLTVGNLDNDNNLDIITGEGGLAVNNLRWWEFNPSTNSYDYRLISLPFSGGLPTTVKIADIDLDGRNELIVAIKMTLNGETTVSLLIFQSYSDNQVTFLSHAGFKAFAQNPMDLTIFDFSGDSNLEIFVSTSASDTSPDSPVTVGLFEYDNQQVTFKEVFKDSFGNNERVYFQSIDVDNLDGDQKIDMILAVYGSASYGGERVSVYEYQY